jgi:hypothetical protein
MDHGYHCSGFAPPLALDALRLGRTSFNEQLSPVPGPSVSIRIDAAYRNRLPCHLPAGNPCKIKPSPHRHGAEARTMCTVRPPEGEGSRDILTA